MKHISFNLVVEDNLLDTDENEKNVSCLIPSGTPFHLRNEALLKCIGTKDYSSNQNKNVDITLYWDMKANNNFKNIIITWPKVYDESSNKKNIYGYYSASKKEGYLVICDKWMDLKGIMEVK